MLNIQSNVVTLMDVVDIKLKMQIVNLANLIAHLFTLEYFYLMEGMQQSGRRPWQGLEIQATRKYMFMHGSRLKAV